MNNSDCNIRNSFVVDEKYNFIMTTMNTINTGTVNIS